MKRDIEQHIDPIETITQSLPNIRSNQHNNEVNKMNMNYQTGNKEEQINYLNASIQEYKEGIGHFQQKLPQVVQGYLDFTGACFQEGAIAEKNKQLMALGISVYSQDEYCIMYHTKMAMDKGANEEEILESVAVASALGGGAAFSQGVTLVIDILNQYQTGVH